MRGPGLLVAGLLIAVAGAARRAGTRAAAEPGGTGAGRGRRTAGLPRGASGRRPEYGARVAVWLERRLRCRRRPGRGADGHRRQWRRPRLSDRRYGQVGGRSGGDADQPASGTTWRRADARSAGDDAARPAAAPGGGRAAAGRERGPSGKPFQPAAPSRGRDDEPDRRRGDLGPGRAVVTPSSPPSPASPSARPRSGRSPGAPPPISTTIARLFPPRSRRAACSGSCARPSTASNSLFATERIAADGASQGARP